MKESRKKKTSSKRIVKRLPSASDKTCFVISPIGKKGTESYSRFREVLDYVIKPGVENSGYRLKVIRADDIERAGSFIKDILESLLNSYVVIADLTENNPNVFYELGVRHSLSPRTILIAQSVDDIPSDLREYRTVIYSTTAKGASEFGTKLVKYLDEISAEPTRSDNPVLDRLPSILETRTSELTNENRELKEKIETILKKGAPVVKYGKQESVGTRVQRIFKLMGAENRVHKVSGGRFTRKKGKARIVYVLPEQQGNFELYFLRQRASTSVYTRTESVDEIADIFRNGGQAEPIESISAVVYFSVVAGELDYKRELADVRILMEGCSKDQNMPCKFIMVTDKDLKNVKGEIDKTFNQMKSFVEPDKRKLFDIEIWDKTGLLDKEKELGIKIHT